jgi:carbonic anhydrase
MNSKSKRKALPLVSILGLLLFLVSAVAQEPHPAHWAYSGPDGPKHWAKLDPAYSACALGHSESPINITRAEPSDLPALTLNYQPIPLNIIDNGHTIQVTVAPGSMLTVGDKTYTLKQFHFHHPSEEHVNGKVLPLEAHLVHQDSEGRLTVVAVLFQEGRANPLLETLWKNIPTEKDEAENVPSISIQVLDLLPADRGYFTFAGSLTTPPCTEGVTWYEFKSYATLSAEQVAAFAKIYPTNARPIQPTNGRNILQSK